MCETKKMISKLFLQHVATFGIIKAEKKHEREKRIVGESTESCERNCSDAEGKWKVTIRCRKHKRRNREEKTRHMVTVIMGSSTAKVFWDLTKKVEPTQKKAMTKI